MNTNRRFFRAAAWLVLTALALLGWATVIVWNTCASGLWPASEGLDVGALILEAIVSAWIVLLALAGVAWSVSSARNRAKRATR